MICEISFNELDDCIDSFDQGVECLEAGIQEIGNAIEVISEVV